MKTRLMDCSTVARVIIPVVGAAMLLVSAARAEEVAPGDTRDAVIERFGEPSGQIVAGDREVLVFPRGEVRLREGQVSEIALLPESVLERRREQREARLEQRTAVERDPVEPRAAPPDPSESDPVGRPSGLDLRAGLHPTYQIPFGAVRGHPLWVVHGRHNSAWRHPRTRIISPVPPEPDDSLRARMAREYEEARRKTLFNAWERRGPKALHSRPILPRSALVRER